MTKTIRIGIAAGRRYDNYVRWLSQSPGVEIVKLSYGDDNLSSVATCQGIVMTGGEDVHPKHYGSYFYYYFLLLICLYGQDFAVKSCFKS